MTDDRVTCPACGGSGGGPFGPRGSAWDVESYECPRCRATGVVSVTGAEPGRVSRPLVKGLDRLAKAPAEAERPTKRRASSAKK